MAWNPPATFNNGAVLTAAQLNQIRESLLESATAKATTAGRIIVTTGLNALVERTPAVQTVVDNETTTSTSFTNLATIGPTVTVTTGSRAMVFFSAFMGNTASGERSYASPEVTGASSVAASDSFSIMFDTAVAGDATRLGSSYMFTGLTPGSNTFTLQYKVTAGTGNFLWRHLFVIPL